ncbi:MAG: hypothetical protein H6698_09740 [Myxococcales bacterium]|nr:hypothetical protein [Myxococcales bacterium]MCB9530911.1 hypothetical protein [Myxococcales bacterium]MCB9534564.1 hypothetical protein [Myxococcales bacterium]
MNYKNQARLRRARTAITVLFALGMLLRYGLRARAAREAESAHSTHHR